jgi:hypothetical protein
MITALLARLTLTEEQVSFATPHTRKSLTQLEARREFLLRDSANKGVARGHVPKQTNTLVAAYTAAGSMMMILLLSCNATLLQATPAGNNHPSCVGVKTASFGI